MTEWNPRYVLYAEAHGFDPEAMLEHDKQVWPGGCMVGFSFWIQEAWRQFPGYPWERENFDEFLKRFAAERRKPTGEPTSAGPKAKGASQ
jgi:hypothetical protein